MINEFNTKTFKLKNILLLGHSMGGKTAMNFACNYPSLLKAMIVVDIAPKKYITHHQKILQGLAGLDFDKIKSRNEADSFLSQFVLESEVRMFLLKNLYFTDLLIFFKRKVFFIKKFILEATRKIRIEN